MANVAEAAGRPMGPVDVLVVNDEKMIQLNRDFRDEAHTTDVLSFDLAEGDDAAAITANIAVCLDEASRKARDLGHSVERELLLYCLHGLLHCAGFDDRDPAAYARMHAEEDRILAAIGVGRTFNAEGQAGEPLQ